MVTVHLLVCPLEIIPEHSAENDDDIVDDGQELSLIIFGTRFWGFTDIKTGPDDFLYVLSMGDGTSYGITDYVFSLRIIFDWK